MGQKLLLNNVERDTYARFVRVKTSSSVSWIFIYILQHLCFVFHRYFSTIFPTRVDQEDGSFPFVNIFRVLLIIIFLFLFMLEIRSYNWTRD